MTLFRVKGIPVRINVSWLLILVLLTYDNFDRLQDRAPDWSVEKQVAIGVVLAMLLFASVVIHELAHSLMALRFNISVKSITLFALGGYAEIESEPRTAGQEMLIAVIGPVSNVVLAVVAGMAFVVMYYGMSGTMQDAGVILAFYMVLGNAVLCLFNIVPAFPLDGGRVLRGVVWKLSGNYELSNNIASIMGIMLGLAMFGWGITNSIQNSIASGIWPMIIGGFIAFVATINLVYEKEEETEETSNLRRRPT